MTASPQMDTSQEMIDDIRWIKTALLEVEEHRKSDRHLHTIRTSIMLFYYIEMHPRILGYTEKLRMALKRKLNEMMTIENVNYPRAEWEIFQNVCERVLSIIAQWEMLESVRERVISVME